MKKAQDVFDENKSDKLFGDAFLEAMKVDNKQVKTLSEKFGIKGGPKPTGDKDRKPSTFPTG